jgi:predicted DNA-binding protein with PD1-like motif
MRVTTLSATTQLLVLERGEPVMARLTEYCAAQGIYNAWLQGLGAVSQVRCGYYDLTSREYVFTEYPEVYEVLQLSGNVMLKKEAPFVHLHATFSDAHNQCFGGHVAEMEVAVTLEVLLTVYPTTQARAYDDNIGLFLINPH